MQMFSFANRGVYGDAVHTPFSWRFRMKHPSVLPVEDKKLLRHYNNKKSNLIVKVNTVWYRTGYLFYRYVVQ